MKRNEVVAKQLRRVAQNCDEGSQVENKNGEMFTTLEYATFLNVFIAVLRISL